MNGTWNANRILTQNPRPIPYQNPACAHTLTAAILLHSHQGCYPRYIEKSEICNWNRSAAALKICTAEISRRADDIYRLSACFLRCSAAGLTCTNTQIEWISQKLLPKNKYTKRGEASAEVMETLADFTLGQERRGEMHQLL